MTQFNHFIYHVFYIIGEFFIVIYFSFIISYLLVIFIIAVYMTIIVIDMTIEGFLIFIIFICLMSSLMWLFGYSGFISMTLILMISSHSFSIPIL